MRIAIITFILIFFTAFLNIKIAESQETAAEQPPPAAPAPERQPPATPAPERQPPATPAAEQQPSATPAAEPAPEETPALNIPSKGSIPEILWRPTRGEMPRYPIDTVIGELGKGKASDAAYNFAVSICAGLLSGDAKHASLTTLNAASRESFLSTIEIIGPVGYRIGSGREEADGAVSFLVRFLGREHGISGELYVRFKTRVNQETGKTTGTWIFEELLLDEVKDRVKEQQDSIYRYDFNPYERFF